MPGYDDLLASDYLPTDDLPANEYDSLVKILDAQTHGALEGIGGGVIAGGEVSAGAGLSVTVQPLQAVLDTVHELVYGASGYVRTVAALPANSTIWIHAVAQFRGGAITADTREDGTLAFGSAGSDEVANGLLLAEVVTGAAGITSISDRRVFAPARVASILGDRLTIAEADIDALDGRVTDIESGAVGGSGPAYWGPLGKASGDPTTITQAIGASIDAHEADMHGGEVEPGGDSGTTIVIIPQDVDAVNQARHLLKYVRSVDPDGAADQVDAATIVWGVYGDGTGGSPDFIDRVNSTWLPT